MSEARQSGFSITVSPRVLRDQEVFRALSSTAFESMRASNERHSADQPGDARKQNRSGCPRNDFLEGVATLVCPLFDHAYPQRRLSRFNVIARFRAVEDGVDADVLWTHRTRPQDLENCTNRQFSTASTPIFFSYRRKKTTKNAASVPI